MKAHPNPTLVTNLSTRILLLLLLPCFPLSLPITCNILLDNPPKEIPLHSLIPYTVILLLFRTIRLTINIPHPPFPQFLAPSNLFFLPFSLEDLPNRIPHR